MVAALEVPIEVFVGTDHEELDGGPIQHPIGQQTQQLAHAKFVNSDADQIADLGVPNAGLACHPRHGLIQLCFLRGAELFDGANICDALSYLVVKPRHHVELRHRRFAGALPNCLNRREETKTMMSMKRTYLKLALLTPFLALQVTQANEPTYRPKAQLVTESVYAIVGPLGQRSEANAGLNANYGFIVTPTGVILIDSGASAHSAAMLEKAVRDVTPKPIRWVLNTGSQDHRWLGNSYFAKRGAEVQAMANTVETQKAVFQQQLQGLERFIGQQLKGTGALQADQVHPAPEKALTIDGVRIQWIETNAHYPGDTMIYLPDASVVFTGDLVYVDRVLGVLPQSNVRKAQAAFQRLVSLSPKYIVPGHGRVTDLAHAKLETGDYYDFLIKNVGAAARNMDSIGETLEKFAKPKQFMHLQNFSELHRANMNRVFVDFEANP
jgi:glyoxylase-like metal-dependent hydrolase (beta-lactamase superfamily II)